jgi:hypothetical protein
MRYLAVQGSHGCSKTASADNIAQGEPAGRNSLLVGRPIGVAHG